jgi:hypothetical protein
MLRREYPKAPTAGYIYVMFSPDFPEFVKIGRTTHPAQRFNQYNNYNPRCSFRYLAISNVCTDCDRAEHEIIQTLHDRGILPSYQQEWFDATHTTLLLELVQGMMTCPSTS